ncbi:hypothetical protein [Actinomadura rupiterrae]|uniref:hypothetical protein n=1 Tax=Actinomadura rupiterrae TaxID=559627 RepID=UPI0020A5ED47|nr:hypothetical protein [Actinomadura rupiterrae]
MRRLPPEAEAEAPAGLHHAEPQTGDRTDSEQARRAANVASVLLSSHPHPCLQEGCARAGVLWITLLDARTRASSSAGCCLRHWALVRLLLERGGFTLHLDQRVRALLASVN